MPVVADFFHDLFEQIGIIVARIITGITQFIQMLKQEILTIMHHIKEAIAEWLSTWVGGLCAVLVVILVYVIGPIAVKFLTDIGLIGMLNAIKAILDKVGEAILIAVHWRELMLISDIAAFIWDDYRNMLNDLYSAFGSLSAELGYEAGFLSLAVRNAATVIRSAGNFLGVPKEYIELEAMDKTAEFLKGVNDHFHYYATHPEHVLKDLDQNIIYPYTDAASDTQGEILYEISETMNTVRTTVDNFNQLKQDTDQLIRDLPEEINSKINTWYKPIADQWDDFYINQYGVEVQRIDNIIERVEQYNQEIRDNADKLKVIATKPMAYLSNLRYVDEVLFNNQIRIMGCLAWQGLQQVLDEHKKPGFIPAGVLVKEMLKVLPVSKTPKILTFEPETLGLEEPQKIAPGKSWQVGDY